MLIEISVENLISMLNQERVLLECPNSVTSEDRHEEEIRLGTRFSFPSKTKKTSGKNESRRSEHEIIYERGRDPGFDF